MSLTRSAVGSYADPGLVIGGGGPGQLTENGSNNVFLVLTFSVCSVQRVDMFIVNVFLNFKYIMFC